MSTKLRKAKIPTALRHAVWNKVYGEDLGSAPCPVCKARMTQQSFECGHMMSEKNGGPTNIDNLTPLCSKCNKSMGSNNMDRFMSDYGFSQGASRPLTPRPVTQRWPTLMSPSEFAARSQPRSQQPKERRQCEATTHSGKQCTYRVAVGNRKYCGKHSQTRPVTPRSTRADAEAGTCTIC